MGQRINGEEGERGLGFLKFDFEEEELGVRGWRVVGKVGFGEEREFRFEGREGEFGFGVELLGVKEDEEGEGARSWERQDAFEEGIGEVDDAGIGGLGLEGLELGE